MTDAQNAVVLVVGGLIIVELGKLVIQFFFKKLARDDYLTKDACEKCVSRSFPEEIQRLEKKFDGCMGEIRGILLVVAVKAGVPADQLKDLTG